MKDNLQTLLKLLFAFIVMMAFVVAIRSHAAELNPCSYVTMINDANNRLDTGNDSNFERIKQQNNQQMVLACQQLEIKMLEERRSDWNRDNY